MPLRTCRRQVQAPTKCSQGVAGEAVLADTLCCGAYKPMADLQRELDTEQAAEAVLDSRYEFDAPRWCDFQAALNSGNSPETAEDTWFATQGPSGQLEKQERL